MSEERIKNWEKEIRLSPFLTGEDDDLMKALISRGKDNKGEDAPSLTQSGLINACKELIYDIKDGKPVFHAILFGFSVSKCELNLGHKLDILVNDGGTDEELEDDIISTLAIAAGLDVPVYPNTKELEPELAHYHRKMLIEGFTAPDGKGDRIRLKLTKSPGQDIDHADYLQRIDSTQAYSPSDLALIRDSVMKELLELRSAEKILAKLNYAIDGLSELLESTTRNENTLQRWLSENPILFGTEYKQIIPKHNLGSEYEMDYALIRHAGVVDLVEIESSNLPLFNRGGNPSKHLVHAEQQVLDWLEWIEVNSSYARNNLPGVYSPKAFVVIGCLKSLTESQEAKLRRRNILFKDQIEILTYDDLLSRATNIKDQLTSLAK